MEEYRTVAISRSSPGEVEALHSRCAANLRCISQPSRMCGWATIKAGLRKHAKPRVLSDDSDLCLVLSRVEEHSVP